MLKKKTLDPNYNKDNLLIEKKFKTKYNSNIYTIVNTKDEYCNIRNDGSNKPNVMIKIIEVKEFFEKGDWILLKD
jgi:hypothetical protein